MADSAPMFFEKNKLDLDNSNITLTVTDAVADDTGQDVVDFIRNRNNTSGWATTGSTNAANTQLDVDFLDQVDIDNIFLIQQNFKAYTIQYWNGSTYTNFSPSISVTGNSTADKRHSFTQVTTSKIRLIITETFVTDDDKFMTQLIATQLIGQLANFPQIKSVKDAKSRRSLKMISGKVKVVRNVGAFSCTLAKNNVVSDADITLMQRLFSSFNGFLVWLSGGDESQFRNLPIGYRLRDLFLMNVTNEYNPEFEDGHYKFGIPIDLDLVEVVE